jgi:hypothetical protein
MITLGIDFSIKSPAVTLLSGDDLVFFAYPRNGTAKENVLLSLDDAGVQVYRLPNEEPLPKKSTIAVRERSSLEDATMQIESIYKSFCERLNDKILVGIEGFSFASTGNRLAQISGYQWVLRYLLHKEGGMKAEDFYIFAPMTVKATAGKGNYKKDDMINAFLQSDDPRLHKSLFWQKLKNESSSFQNKKGGWEKPIDDIIDSYWVLRTLENNTKELLKDS